MRKIEFRAWEKENKILLPVSSLNMSANTISVYNPNDDTPYDYILNYSETILMQYTGLKDRRGVDIYEGDVVRSNRTYPRDSEAAKKFNGYVGQVYYDIELGSWWITTTAEPCADHEHTCQAATVDAFEVIGNIWENPELLK